MQQLGLFRIDKTEELRLRVAAEQARQRAAALRCLFRRIGAPLCFLQLDIWGEPVTICVAPPRRPVPPRPEPIQTGPLATASVFTLASTGRALGHRLWKQPAAEPAPYRVEREDGRVRLIRMRPDETEEWQERERARRARQKPPKPTAGAKTRGKKVRAWDGEGRE